MPRKAFPPPFGGPAQPDPHDIALIGTQLAMAQGTARGMTDKLQHALNHGMAGPAQVADQVAERFAESLNSEIGDAQLVADALAAKFQSALIQGLMPVVEAAAALGFVPAGAPGQGAGGKAKRRGKRGKRTLPQYEQPPSLTGRTGDAAGGPGDDGPDGPQAPPGPAVQGGAAAGGNVPPAGLQPAQNVAQGFIADPDLQGGASGGDFAGGGPAGGPGVGIFNPPGGLGRGIGLPALGALPGGPAGPAGGFGELGGADAPGGTPGGATLPVWFQPFWRGDMPGLGKPGGGSTFNPPGGPAGGGGFGVPNFKGGGPGGGGGGPGGVGQLPGGGFGPPPPPPPDGGGGGGSAGGGGAGGNGVGGGGGGGPGGGGGGQGGGGGGGGNGGNGPPGITVNVSPTPVNLSCPAPVVQLQCPACGTVGFAPTSVNVAPAPVNVQAVAPVNLTLPAQPAAAPTVNVTVAAPGPSAGPATLPGLVQAGPAPPQPGGPAVPYSPLVPVELVLGQLPAAPQPAPTRAAGADQGGAGVGQDSQALPDGVAAQSVIAACLPGAPSIRRVAGKTVLTILREVGYLDAENNPQWLTDAFNHLSGQTGWFGDIGRATVNVGGFVQYWGVRALEWIQANAPGLSGCEGPDVGTAWVVQLLIGLVRRVIPSLPHSLTYDWDTYCKWACPIAIPEQTGADDMRRKGLITDADWQCLTRANGNDVRWAALGMDAGRPWPTIDQVISMERRGVIPPDYKNLVWERNEVRTADLRNLHRRAADWVPSPGDAVEWMLKDVADPNITGTFGLHAEFQQKFAGKAKEAFDANGVSASDALTQWAAHWRNMDPHTLYEMHKRLRPGWTASMADEYALTLATAIAPRRPAGWAPPPKPAGFVGHEPVYYFLDDLESRKVSGKAFLENLTTSGFHLYEALGQADYPPFWRERLMAISYNVLTRTDSRRAYDTGQINAEQLVGQLLDRGYNPADAGYLRGIYYESAVQQHARRPPANSWVKTGYSVPLLKQALIDQGMRPDQWPDVFRRLEVKRKIEIEQRCLANLKRQVLAGLVDDEAISPRLMAVGLTGDEADRLRREWNCEKRSVPKVFSAAQVCKYLHQNLIGPDQAVKLIRRAGYTAIQARRIVNSCLLSPPSKKLRKRSELDAALAEAQRAAPPEEGGAGPGYSAAGGALGAAGAQFAPGAPAPE